MIAINTIIEASILAAIGFLGAVPAFIIRYIFKKQFSSAAAAVISFFCVLLSITIKAALGFDFPLGSGFAAIFAYIVLRAEEA